MQSFIQQPTTQTSGRPPILSFAAEVLLFFLYLRHYLVDVILALLFDIDSRSVYNIRLRMIDYFYQLLSPQLSLKTFDWRSQNAVEFYYQLYTFTVDGVEQP